MVGTLYERASSWLALNQRAEYAIRTTARIPATTNPAIFKNLFMTVQHNLLTIHRHKTQHLVVHRFARERDEKGMR
jgi:hypothetical protein